MAHDSTEQLALGVRAPCRIRWRKRAGFHRRPWRNPKGIDPRCLFPQLGDVSALHQERGANPFVLDAKRPAITKVNFCQRRYDTSRMPPVCKWTARFGGLP